LHQDVTAGGFVAGTTEDGSPIIRNPATRPTMELLDNVLALARFAPVLCFDAGFVFVPFSSRQHLISD